jgi:hypothetical protein
VTNVAISGRHSCTIRATDGAVLCSGNNQVRGLRCESRQRAAAVRSDMNAQGCGRPG